MDGFRVVQDFESASDDGIAPGFRRVDGRGVGALALELEFHCYVAMNRGLSPKRERQSVSRDCVD